MWLKGIEQFNISNTYVHKIQSIKSTVGGLTVDHFASIVKWFEHPTFQKA